MTAYPHEPAPGQGTGQGEPLSDDTQRSIGVIVHAVPAAALAVVPVWLDRVFNPALSAVLLFALLVTVLVAAGYCLAAGRRPKNRPAVPPSRPY